MTLRRCCSDGDLSCKSISSSSISSCKTLTWLPSSNVSTEEDSVETMSQSSFASCAKTRTWWLDSKNISTEDAADSISVWYPVPLMRNTVTSASSAVHTGAAVDQEEHSELREHVSTVQHQGTQSARLKRQLRVLQARGQGSSPLPGPSASDGSCTKVQGFRDDSAASLAPDRVHACKGGKRCLDITFKGKCRAGETCRYCHDHGKDAARSKQTWQSSRLKARLAQHENVQAIGIA